MAVKSLYFKNVVANGALSLQDGGSAPAAALTTTGWAVGKIAVNNYSIMLAGTEKTTATFSTTDALATPAFSAASCWRSEQPFLGKFANTNWTMDFKVRAVNSATAQRGAIKARIWKSADPAGAGAVQLTSAMLTGTTTLALSTTASQTSTVTWLPGSVQVFDDEYLWVQCEWQITTIATNNNADVDFYIEPASPIITSDFVASIGGDGGLTNPDGAVAVGAGLSESFGTGALTNPDGAVIDAEGIQQAPGVYGDGILGADIAFLAGDGLARDPVIGTGALVSDIASTGGSATPWTPTLVAGLEGWHDASQLALADGAGVPVWTNMGAGAVPTMVGSPLPVFKTGILDGKPVVRFSANEGRLRAAFSHPLEHTVVYIARRWGATGGRCFTAPYPEGGNHLIGYHTSGYDVMHDDGGWIVTATPYPATGTDPWRMYGADGKPTEGVRFFRFGELLGSGPTAGNYGPGYNISGYAMATAEETGDFDVAEVLVYDSKLATADREKVEGYLAWKWGLEANLLAGHPHKDAAPTVSGAASDGVVGSTGTGTLVSDGVGIVGSETPAFLGGVLVMGKATVAGVGKSSVSGLGDLLPHLAA